MKNKSLVVWNFDFKKILKQEFSSRQWANKVQEVVDQDIKGSISKGVSPVIKKRLFQKYKNPKKYPAHLKPSNKPNLYLTGEMLSFYKAKPVENEQAITVGIHSSDASEKVMIKAKANNEGTDTIPERRFVPIKGETYNQTIMLKIRNKLAEVLGFALKTRRGR